MGDMSRGRGHQTALARLEKQRQHDAYIDDLKCQVQEHNLLKGRALWETTEMRRSGVPRKPHQPWPDSSDMPRTLRHDHAAWESASPMAIGQDGVARRQRLLQMDGARGAQDAAPESTAPPAPHAAQQQPMLVKQGIEGAQEEPEAWLIAAGQPQPGEVHVEGEDVMESGHAQQSCLVQQAEYPPTPPSPQSPRALLAAWHRAALSVPEPVAPRCVF